MNLKKLVAILMALVLAVCSVAAVAESTKSQETAEAKGSGLIGCWTDEGEVYELYILTGYNAWIDDRMGEELGEDDLVIHVYRTTSDTAYDDFRMTGKVSEDGKKIEYKNGLYTHIDLLPQADDEEDGIYLLEDMGKGTLTLMEDGSLKWEDSFATEAAQMKLVKYTDDVPGMERIADSFFKPVAALETESAGSALKKAEAVCGLYRMCALVSFWNMDGDALCEAMEAAYQSLTEEEKQAYEKNEGLIAQAVLELLEEGRDMDGIYEDAGVADELTFYVYDQCTRMSVESFLSYAETLENAGEI